MEQASAFNDTDPNSTGTENSYGDTLDSIQGKSSKRHKRSADEIVDDFIAETEKIEEEETYFEDEAEDDGEEGGAKREEDVWGYDPLQTQSKIKSSQDLYDKQKKNK